LPRLKESMGPRFVPVIIISSDNDIVTKIAAFGVGADDYVSKPADPNELRMRIEARLRAVQFITGEKHIISFGNVKMDVDKMVVEIQSTQEGPRNIELTPYEFKILKLLLSRPKQVYTRELIIDQVWGVDKFITSRTVDAHISHLRKKLSAGDISIDTVLGTGYKIELKDRIAA
ncbi:MAG: response regulator transcription factor, partial [Pseudobdellovibrio sp.]